MLATVRDVFQGRRTVDTVMMEKGRNSEYWLFIIIRASDKLLHRFLASLKRRQWLGGRKTSSSQNPLCRIAGSWVHDSGPE